MKKRISVPSFSAETILILGFVLFKLAIHLLTNGFAGYGIFRDEFYYLSCSYRWDFGYVDQPPLSIYILTISRLLFGKSLFAIRLIPSIFGALTVFFTGKLVLKMGGKINAVIVSSLAVIIAPIILAMNGLYSMNAIDIFLWTLGAYVLVGLLNAGVIRHWISLGLIIGFGLLNKISMAWFAIGVGMVLLITKHRRHLKTKWPYLSAVIALGCFLPFIIWNMTHDWAHLEFIRNASQWKYSGLIPVDFILGQFQISNPATLPLWIGGLVFFFFTKYSKPYRMLGIIFLTTFIILLINGHSKPEYLSPAYPILFAAGGLQIERWSFHKMWKWTRFALPAFMLIGGLVIAPIVLPFLPVKKFIQYAQAIGFQAPSVEGKELSELPQHYADMFGWKELTETVHKVYDSIPNTEKDQTVVFARNYGQAGSLEYYRKDYNLPPVISSHNNFWIWGWKELNPKYQTVIVLEGNKADLLNTFEEVSLSAVKRCQYCMPYENNLPVFICRTFKRPLLDIWDSTRHYE